MNNAHLHLLVNHFPIIGNVVAIVMFVWSFVVRKRDVTILVLAFTIAVAVSGWVTDFTGGKAAGEIRNLPGITKSQIRDHAQSADVSLYLLYAAGAFAALALFLVYRNHHYAHYAVYASFALSLVTSYFMYRTGYLGGLIRHPEIVT